MNVVFVGGGSFRTLPIVCGVLQNPKVMNGGETRLVDFNLPRVESVGRLIMRTPEFAKSGCWIGWPKRRLRAAKNAGPAARTGVARGVRWRARGTPWGGRDLRGVAVGARRR